MIRSKLKSGFTLIELMVFFIFISILLAASTPIITKRVKNLPLKVYHGKYMCYRNDAGALVEEYYNASIRVTPPTVVEACHFNPPKKATVYKIEMIGGGAGGYEYFGGDGNERVLTDEQRDCEYRIDYGMFCINTRDHKVPDNAQLKRIFNGASFRRFSSSVGQGGRGLDIQLKFGPLGIKTNANAPGVYLDPEFKVKSEYEEFFKDFEEKENCSDASTEDLKVMCEDDKAKVAAANALITKMKSDIYTSLGNPYYYIYAGNANVAQINEILAPYRTFNTSNGLVEHRASARNGGSGGYLQYDGRIDFVDYSRTPAVSVDIDSVDNYLQGLPNHIVSGSLSAPANDAACTGWIAERPSDGTSKGETYLQGLDDDVLSAGCKNGSDPECKGGDVLRYGALKLWNKWCISNETRATGGEGAWADLNGKSNPQHYSYSDWSKLNLPTNAGGVVGDDSTGLGYGHSFSFSNTDSGGGWPSLIINTYLHNVTHTVGLNGTSGNVKTVFESNLRDDCVFTIGKNGRVITELDTNSTVANLQSGLATTLSCNDHTINHRVDGGRYQKNTFSDTRSEFEYMSNSSNFSFPTEPRTDGSASQYNPTNIFTRYNIGSHDFGKGGAGSGIVDNCMHPQGYYRHALKNYDGSIGRSESYNLDPFTCEMDNPAHFRKIDPTEGVGGAIIISW